MVQARKQHSSAEGTKDYFILEKMMYASYVFCVFIGISLSFVLFFPLFLFFSLFIPIIRICSCCLFFFLIILVSSYCSHHLFLLFLFILTVLTVYSQVVASGLLRRKAVVLCAEKKNFQTLSELTQCMRYSTVKTIAIIYFFMLLVLTSLYSSHPHLFSFLFY